MDTDLILRFEDVSKSYGKKRVLSDVNFSLAEGCVLGLAGHNGAGKSTLMELAASVSRPTSGKVSYANGLRIGYVPQSFSLYEELTVTQNLCFWGMAAGLSSSEAKERGLTWLSKMGLVDKAGEEVSALSGGMKRKLHLATALLGDPKLLILDEPTEGCDPDATAVILEIIKTAREGGASVLLSTHRAGELELVSDEILVVSDGKLRREGAE